MLGEFVEKGKPKVFPYFEGLINNNQEKKDKIDDWIKYGDYCVRLVFIYYWQFSFYSQQ